MAAGPDGGGLPRRSGATDFGGIEPGGAEVVDVWQPERFASRYLDPGGSIYGNHSHGWKNAFFRPANRSAEVRGLYFAGGSSHPGGGTPPCCSPPKLLAI